MWWWSFTAVAATWHPADVAAQSVLFDRLSARQAAVFEDRNRSAAQLSAALRAWRESIEALGERAPAAEREAMAAAELDYNRQFARLQAHADQAVGETESTFGVALDRAIRAMNVTDEPCEATRPVGGVALPGMPMRTEKNPSCSGDDINSAIAKRLDQDPDLIRFVEAELAADWPALALAPVAMAPVGDGARNASVSAFLHAAAAAAMRAVDKSDDSERQKAGLDLATAEEAAMMVDVARGIAARTAAARAGVADPLFQAADKVFARWVKDGEPGVAWCAHPSGLGGCTGTDATDDILRRLLDEPRIRKFRE